MTGFVVSGLNHAMHSMSGTDDSEAIREKIASNAEAKYEPAIRSVFKNWDCSASVS